MTPEELQAIIDEIGTALLPILEKNQISVVLIGAVPFEVCGMNTYNSTPETTLAMLEQGGKRIESQLQDIAENN